MSQQDVSDRFGHGKAWLSKIELGDSDIAVADYVRIVDMLREGEPDHPSVKLADRIKRAQAVTPPPPKPRLRLVKD